MTTAKRRQSTKRMHEGRVALEERCNGLCEKCGRPLPVGDGGYRAEDHHRKLRTRQGSDGLSNRMLVHSGCHNQHRGSIHDNPNEATEAGWMVHSWDDPADIPLLYMGRRALLADDGQVIYLDDQPF